MTFTSAPRDATEIAHSGPPFPKVALITLGGAYFVLGCAALGAVGMIEEMRLGLGVSAAAVASMVTVYSLIYAVSAPLAQAAVGHLARRLAIAGGLAALALGCFLTAMAQSYAMLIGARVLMGLGAAVTGPFLTAAAATMVAPHDRARALAMVFGGMTASTVLGLPLASFLAQTLGWRWAWVAIGVVALAASPVIWTLLPGDNRGERARPATLLAILRNRAAALSIGAAGVAVAGQFTAYALVAVWLAEVAGMGAASIPPILLLLGVGGVAGNAIAAKVERLFGGAQAVLISLVGNMCFMILTPFLASFPIMLLIAMFLWSAICMILMPPLQSRLVGLDPDRASLALALNSSAVYLGMAGGSSIGGLVYALQGPTWLFPVAACVMCVAISIYALTLKADR